jgi:hypothetical protein
VQDPHLMSLSITNVRSRDIASARFNDSKNLRIDLNCTMYGLIQVPEGGAKNFYQALSAGLVLSNSLRHC